MRLDDLRRNVRDETDIPAEVERELEVLDAALRGEEVPPGMEGIEALVSDLRAERQDPEPRFEEKLDAWAAAGFPRGKGPRTRAAGGGAGDNKGGFFSQFSPNGPRGWSPVAATAAVVVVVGVSLTQIGDFGGDDPTTAGTTQEVSGEAADVDTDAAGGGAAAPDVQEDGDDTATKLEDALGPVEDGADAGGKAAELAAPGGVQGSQPFSRPGRRIQLARSATPPAPATTAARRSAASTAKRS